MRVWFNSSILVRTGLMLACAASSVTAADPPSAVGPLLGLLQKGSLPPERLPGVVKLVCERGNEHDLSYIVGQAAASDWSAELRRDALAWLGEAVATRKVRPAGDLKSLVALLDDNAGAALRPAAIRLVSLLKLPEAVEPLQRLADAADAPSAQRDAAVAALIAYGGDTARQTIDGLLAPQQPVGTKIRGVAALVGLDPAAASTRAAEVLQQATPGDDPAPLVDAFLNAKGGADRLAAALRSTPPSQEVALLALRHMYAVGRSDPALDGVLSELAGIRGEAPKLTEAEIKAKAEEATTHGDAARGEAVFRRADLACFRCHALSKAGGQIGPDLSSVGVSSPVDYLVKSVYDPDAQKKEEYVTRILLTLNGQQLTGIVTRRTDDKLTLKAADGKLVDVPVADIEFEGEGRSLMPEGLVKFMTEQELLDLIKFISQLGKPGTPYAIRQTQRLQRWRVLKSPPAAVLERVPDEEVLGDLVLAAAGWEPAYGRVNGELPLEELTARTGQRVLYLQGEINASAAGPATIRLNDPAGVTLWLGDTRISSAGSLTIELVPGVQTLTLRVDTAERQSTTLSLEVERPAGTSAQFSVVDGA